MMSIKPLCLLPIAVLIAITTAATCKDGGVVQSSFQAPFGATVSWVTNCTAKTITITGVYNTGGWVAAGWNVGGYMVGANVVFGWVQLVRVLSLMPTTRTLALLSQMPYSTFGTRLSAQLQTTLPL